MASHHISVSAPDSLSAWLLKCAWLHTMSGSPSTCIYCFLGCCIWVFGDLVECGLSILGAGGVF